MDYLKPEMEILILLEQDIVTMSEGADNGDTPSVDFNNW